MRSVSCYTLCIIQSHVLCPNEKSLPLWWTDCLFSHMLRVSNTRHKNAVFNYQPVITVPFLKASFIIKFKANRPQPPTPGSTRGLLLNWTQLKAGRPTRCQYIQILAAKDKQAVKSPDLHRKPPKAEVSYVHSDPPTLTELRCRKGNFSWLKAASDPARTIFLPFSIFTATVTASFGRSLSIPTASAMTTCPKQPSPRGLPSVSLEV